MWDDLKEAVSAIITSNGANQITGKLLRELLNNNIIPRLGAIDETNDAIAANQAATALALALAGVDQDSISFDQNVLPSITGVDGTIGAYFTEQNMILLKEDSGSWNQIKAFPAFNVDDLSKYVTPRHSLIRDKIFSATSATIPQGFAIGDSIMQGTGASSPPGSKTIAYQFAQWLQLETGVGSVNDWAPRNLAVGGSTTRLGLMYIADHYDKDSQKINNLVTSKSDYALVHYLRNDVSNDLDEFEFEFRLLMNKLINDGVEPIFITPPPKMNTSDNTVEDTQANFGDWKDVALQICGQLGVSVVDAHKYFVDYVALGNTVVNVAQASIGTNDGTHWNDLAYEFIGKNLIPACILGESNPVIPESYEGVNDITAGYVHSNLTGTLETFTGLTTPTTSRKENIDPSEADNYVFKLDDGEYVDFVVPVFSKGYIVPILQQSGASGSLQVRQSTGYIVNTIPMTSYASSVVREKCAYVKLSPTNETIYNPVGTIRLQATGGTCYVLGIGILCEKQTSFLHKPVDSVEVGSWSDQNLVSTDMDGNTVTGRQSSTVGNTLTIRWWGSSLTLKYVRGTSFGKFTYETDGGVTTEKDCYINAPDLDQLTEIARSLEVGWHETVITVTTKNASAVANNIRIGFVKIFSQGAFFNYATLQSGIEVNKSEKRNYKQQYVLSGSGFLRDSKKNTTVTSPNSSIVLLE